MGTKSVKIELSGTYGDIETLWADIVSEGRYRLDNAPWYAYGVSFHDIISAVPTESGTLVFERVLEKSGNRTMRLILEVDETTEQWTFESRQLMERLQALGCEYEGMNAAFLALNVPPAVDLSAVATLLGLRHAVGVCRSTIRRALSGRAR